MTNITEARQRLDKTLTSHELSDRVAIRKIVLKRLQNSFTGSFSLSNLEAFFLSVEL
jgi:hypothetical protein